MPTLPPANAPFGSTQRPVQATLLIAPDSVALASRSRTAAASGVLKAGFFRSGDNSSTPFIFINGQYSQSKLSVMNPVFSPFAIACENEMSSSNEAGGAERPASLNMILL